MSVYQPPPTYAEVVLVDEKTGQAKFNPIWLDWFIRLVKDVSASGTTDHNTLNNLQGGAANQYYHLTAAQQALVVAALHNALNGLQGGTTNEYYHFTAAEHTLLAAFLHNSLNTLQGGTSGEYYHLTSAEYTGTGSGVFVRTSSPTITTPSLVGVTNAGSAAAGRIGEVLESVASAVNFPTSGQYGDLTSQALTAGNWLVTATLDATGNGATGIGQVQMGISTTSGNSGTGLVTGSNALNIPGLVAAGDISGCIANYVVRTSGTPTLYFKLFNTYTGGPPQGYGRLTALRFM